MIYTQKVLSKNKQLSLVTLKLGLSLKVRTGELALHYPLQ